MAEQQQGPLGRLMEGYERETDMGPIWIHPLDSIVELAKNAGGDTCPKCGHHYKIFFGDPDGDHWCICCQAIQEFGLKTADQDMPDDPEAYYNERAEQMP